MATSTAAVRDNRASALTRVSENDVSDSRWRTVRPRRPLADAAQVEEDVMRSSMCLLGVALGGAPLFATIAMAGGLPKEGAFNVADETRGSYEQAADLTPGEARSWYESGKSFGDGILEGMAWSCFGMPEVIQGTLRRYKGYCVGRAQDGDQLAFRIEAGLASELDEKSQVSGSSTEGSGKYLGIIATYTATCTITVTKNGYTKNCNGAGVYKLP